MRTEPFEHLEKALKTKHHTQRAYTKALKYYRYRNYRYYFLVIATYRTFLQQRRTAKI